MSQSTIITIPCSFGTKYVPEYHNHHTMLLSGNGVGRFFYPANPWLFCPLSSTGSRLFLTPSLTGSRLFSILGLTGSRLFSTRDPTGSRLFWGREMEIRPTPLPGNFWSLPKTLVHTFHFYKVKKLALLIHAFFKHREAQVWPKYQHIQSTTLSLAWKNQLGSNRKHRCL